MQQRPEQLGGQQRNVGVGDQHVPDGGRDPLHSDANRIGGAQLRLLADGRNGTDVVGSAAQFRFDLVGTVTGDHDRMLDTAARERIQDVQQHRSACQMVEDLWQARAHPGPLAGGQDDGRGG
jgi:hypothetical protein